MKKKIIAVSLIIAMMAVTVIGGTMAYFFDTASATNTFTVGNVDISLEEKGEDNVTDFDQDQQLWPGADPTAKRAWITNNSENEAWVWAEVLIPAALDVTTDASKNSLHFNYYGQFLDDYYDANWSTTYSQTPEADGILDAEHNPTIEGMVEVSESTLWTLDSTVKTVTINDVEYNVYLFKMEETLAGESTSLPFLRQVYMDAGVTLCTDSSHASGCLILKNGEHYTGSWELIVNAYAMQAEGFDTVDAAIAAFAESNK